MIKATFKCKPDNHITQFEITGHADSGPYGQDIVCAAVSAVTIGTINSLQKLTKIDPKVESDDLNGGYLKCKVDLDSITDSSQLIAVRTLMDSCYQTMLSIAQNYTKFIKIKLITLSSN